MSKSRASKQNGYRSIAYKSSSDVYKFNKCGKYKYSVIKHRKSNKNVDLRKE